jgi:hypothetical protein
MPVATNVVTSQYTRGVGTVMLNYGTVLTNTTDENVIVRTSRFAYLDEDLDGDVGGAPLQQYPIAAVEPLGSGTVIAVSDPSIFVNAMQDRASNAAFVRGLVDGAGQVILDYSHADPLPPISAALLWLRRTPLALAAVGVIGVVFVGVVGRWGLPAPSLFVADTPADRGRTPVDEQSVLAYIRQEHPGWSPERVTRVIADVITVENESERDE